MGNNINKSTTIWWILGGRCEIMKRHMRGVTGLHVLNYEKLVTIITQIEAVLNSRPLYPTSKYPTDLSPDALSILFWFSSTRSPRVRERERETDRERERERERDRERERERERRLNTTSDKNSVVKKSSRSFLEEMEKGLLCHSAVT